MVNRKNLFFGGLAAWTLSTAWLFLFFQHAPHQWPLDAVILATAAGAFGSSAAILELRRAVSSDGAAWTDEVHMRWVGIWAVVFFVVQFIGISLALKAH